MDTPSALHALLRIAAHDPDPAVRLAALAATVRYAWGESLRPLVIDAIEEFLRTCPDHPQAGRLLNLPTPASRSDLPAPTRAERQQIGQITALLVTLPDPEDRLQLLDTLGQPMPLETLDGPCPGVETPSRRRPAAARSAP